MHARARRSTVTRSPCLSFFLLHSVPLSPISVSLRLSRLSFSPFPLFPSFSVPHLSLSCLLSVEVAQRGAKGDRERGRDRDRGMPPSKGSEEGPCCGGRAIVRVCEVGGGFCIRVCVHVCDRGVEGAGGAAVRVYVYVVRHLLRARTSTSRAQPEAPRRA